MENWILPSGDERKEMEQAQLAADAASAKSEDERRVNRRLALHATVSCQSETNFFFGFSENISEGGVFVSTFSPPAVGERVQLKISVEGSGSVTVWGDVRWHRTAGDGSPTGCGVAFGELGFAERTAIEMLVHNAEREPLFHEV
jgi:uncharacterized protein (TIGR02266 family)